MKERKIRLRIYYRQFGETRFQKVEGVDEDYTGYKIYNGELESAFREYIEDVIDTAELSGEDVIIEGEYYAAFEDVENCETIAETDILSVRYKDGMWTIE